MALFARVGRVVVAMAVAGVLLAGCDSGDDDVVSGDETTSSTAPSTTTTIGGSPQDDAVRVSMKEFSFDPKDVTVTKSAIALKLSNTGSARHTFTADDPKLDQEVEPGKETEVLIAMGAKTEFTFYCRFHRASGMQGKVVLKP